MRVYLDYAATTPLDSGAETVMRPLLFLQGNPSSVHRDGAQAREILEDARAMFASAIGATAREIVFTSGGTEANNQAIFAYGLQHGGHIITSQIEHSAILAPARALAANGYCQLTLIAPNKNGIIEPEEVREAMQPNTKLVSVQHVNNEVGVIQDIAAIAKICHGHGALLHTDAVQSLGVVPLNISELDADLVSVSAHKFYGPKGVGALFVRHGLDIPSFMMGGHQEGSLRGGTHNLPGIFGMAHAAQKAKTMQPTEFARLSEMRNYLETELCNLPGVQANATSANRSPKVLSITTSGADGEALLMSLDLEGISASMGSACNAGTLEPSHVLLAMGLSQSDARASLRFSFGRETTMEELKYTVAAFEKSLARVR